MKGFELDEKLLRKLAAVMEDSGLTEVEMADGEKSLRVARQIVAQGAMPPVAMAAAVPAPTAATATAAAGGAADAGYPDADVLTSPMVGTAYLSPEPGAASFVKVGDQVTPDKTVMIIEAMKVMNPIRAHKAGTVVHIMISDAQPVEFGEPLLVIQ